MKNVIIFPGWGETPNSFWFPYLKRELEKRGYRVSIPILPDTNNPKFDKWINAALKENYNSETVLIGHSATCPLILSILDRINVKIKQAILVAGFYTLIGTKVSEELIQKEYNWEKIRVNCGDFIFINSKNDPYKCNETQGKYAFDHLGGILIINNEGHMGSDFYNQPYREFPFLLKFIS